jgi:hypothetical protein
MRQFNGAVAALVLLSAIFVAPARAQSTVASVPQPWIEYAQLVGHQFETWLEADDQEVSELHTYLERRIVETNADAPPPAIMIRAWIGTHGEVTRVEFGSLGDAKIDGILHHLLTTNPVAEPPPPNMPQPLRVRLHLTPNAQAGTGAG